MKTIITANTLAASLFALLAVFATIYANDFTATVLFTGIACGLFVSSFLAVLFLLAERRADILQRIPATIKRATAFTARTIKRAARIAWTVLVLAVVLAVTLTAFYFIAGAASDLLQLAGLHGMTRALVFVVLLFTVILDLTIWVELNAMAIASRLGTVRAYNDGPIAFRARPVSIIAHLVREFRNA